MGMLHSIVTCAFLCSLCTTSHQSLLSSSKQLKGVCMCVCVIMWLSCDMFVFHSATSCFAISWLSWFERVEKKNTRRSVFVAFTPISSHPHTHPHTHTHTCTHTPTNNHRRLSCVNNMILSWLTGRRRSTAGRTALRRSEWPLPSPAVPLTSSTWPYRARDARNKELFEKLFPELRTKRDQLRDQAERFSRYAEGSHSMLLCFTGLPLSQGRCAGIWSCA